MNYLDISLFKQQLSNVKPPISTAHSLSPACYSDAEVLELEKKYIFQANWIGLGRADQWQNSGNYSSLEIVGIPIIVLRDNKNKLRAFANSCRHRGAKLLDSHGTCQVIRCPFHRWTYALDGRLLTAPKIKNGNGFDYGQYGLIEILIEERYGFAFLNLDGEAKNIDDYLQGFELLHAPWSFDELVSYKRHEFEVGCNWKAFLDVFNEYYHLPYVHPDSINNIYLAPEPSEQVSGDFASQFGATEGTGALLESTQQYMLPKIKSLDERTANGARYSWVFPNMTFAAGTESVWIYEAYPINPQRSHIVLTLCFPKSTTQLDDFEFRANYYFERLLAAIEEDISGIRKPTARFKFAVGTTW